MNMRAHDVDLESRQSSQFAGIKGQAQVKLELEMTN
jgi:hypothetical protein